MAQIDSSIYNAFAPRVKSVADYDNERAQGQMNQLNLLRGQQQADEYTRKVGQENAFRTFQKTLAGKARPDAAQALIDAGYITEGNSMLDAHGKYEKAQADIRQSDAAALNSTATATKAGLEARIKAHEFAAQEATAVRSAPEAVEWAKRSFAMGAFGDPKDPDTIKAVQQKIAELGQMQTPQQLEEWRTGAVKRGTDIKTQLENQHRQITAAETQRHNKTTEGISAGQLGVARDRLGLERQNAAGAVTYQQGADGTLMALPTKPGAGPVTQRAVVDAQGNPVKGRAPGRGTGMSATAQKELFEAEDGLAAANNVISMLTEAGKLNDKAYSGLGASVRSKIVSNLGGSDSADATVNLDNIMTGQALESLKSTFGAAPTEGERKILMDIQASTDKTPAQRKVIIDRAIEMAKKRVAFNSNKAKSLREGTYFSEQNPSPAPDGASPVPQGKFLGYE